MRKKSEKLGLIIQIVTYREEVCNGEFLYINHDRTGISELLDLTEF